MKTKSPETLVVAQEEAMKAVNDFIDTLKKAFEPVIEGVKKLVPIFYKIQIQKEVSEIIDEVYAKNSIEFMFDSENIKKDLIEKIADYVIAHDSKAGKK